MSCWDAPPSDTTYPEMGKGQTDKLGGGTDVIERFLDEWESRGYQNVTVSLWHGIRLYVNIPGEPAFYYRVDKQRGRCRNYWVSGTKLLAGRLFQDAWDIGRFIVRNRDGLLRAMDGGGYFSRQERRNMRPCS